MGPPGKNSVGSSYRRGVPRAMTRGTGPVKRNLHQFLCREESLMRLARQLLIAAVMGTCVAALASEAGTPPREPRPRPNRSPRVGCLSPALGQTTARGRNRKSFHPLCRRTLRRPRRHRAVIRLRAMRARVRCRRTSSNTRPASCRSTAARKTRPMVPLPRPRAQSGCWWGARPSVIR